jgi:hypothetical protein
MSYIHPNPAAGLLAAMNAYALLDALTTPVWIILPATDEILFANRQAQPWPAGKPWPPARRLPVGPRPGTAGRLHAHHAAARAGGRNLDAAKQDEAQALCCHLGHLLLEDGRHAILVEGMLPASHHRRPCRLPQGEKAVFTKC